MIRELKLKFVVLAMTALVVLLSVIVAGMNIINYNSVVNEADTVLSVLSQNRGAFPDFIGDNKGDRLPPNMSPETPYESRYFSVSLNDSGAVVNTDTSKVVSLDDNTAIAYANMVFNSGKSSGFIGAYRYIRHSEMSGWRIIFLDCTQKLESFYNFLYTSIAMSFIGLIVVFVIIFIMSGRIIKPIAESYQKQKRFITDAGHEIKTPLTIINANVDILEMELGQNESLADIQQQTKRLKSLTNDLVMLARMEEAGENIQKIEFPISEVVAETAHPFCAIAKSQGKEFVCNIQPMLSLKGNDKAIEQLVSILMDNALKYSPEGSAVELSLMKQNKFIYLSVYNTTETEVTQEQLRSVFDRFYRTDSSRNSETGGHGIGLSVAKAIVTAHGGKIQAFTKDGKSFQITAVLPI